MGFTQFIFLNFILKNHSVAETSYYRVTTVILQTILPCTGNHSFVNMYIYIIADSDCSRERIFKVHCSGSASEQDVHVLSRMCLMSYGGPAMWNWGPGVLSCMILAFPHSSQVFQLRDCDVYVRSLPICFRFLRQGPHEVWHTLIYVLQYGCKHKTKT